MNIPEYRQDGLFDPIDQMQQAVHAPGHPMAIIFAGPPITAQEAANTAIAQVEAAAPLEWREYYRRAIEYVARRRLRFNADPVWERFQSDYCRWEDAHPRAAGAVIRRAMKDGVIVPVKNMFWNSKRRSCHGRPIAVYQSLMFDPLSDVTDFDMQ